MQIRQLLAYAVFALAIPFSGAVASQGQEGSAYDFAFTVIDGSAQIDLGEFRGRPVLVVNTASFCGFTPQYSGLEALWRAYKDQGLMVIGVPSNDFGAQEPGTEAEIQHFCEGAFSVTFPLTKKYTVKGAGAHAFYKWVDANSKGKGKPSWNFHKVLVGADGRLAAWFPSAVKPKSKRLTGAVEKELAAGGS